MICLLALFSTLATASPDLYGFGDAHHGALVVGGVINVNEYRPLDSDVLAGDTIITVASSMGVLVGDLIAVHQVHGLDVAVPSGVLGSMDLSPQATGSWEFARVTTILGNQYMLDNGLLRDYAAADTQVIRVPEFSSVTVSMGGSLQPLAWNGSVGGVLIFLSQGAVVVDGVISASGAGFRGGNSVNLGNLDGCTGGDVAPPFGAQKGEGLHQVFGGSATGFAPWTLGGGGGVCHASGGGGGGHGGEGGRGGTSDDGDRDVGGRGGAKALYNTAERIVLGGGAGAGHGHNSSSTSGGRGGGAIWMRAQSLSGVGELRADGESAADSSDDGAGGGGAGGLIAGFFEQTLGCALASALGGDGGDSRNNNNGPGGGGAGGRIYLQGSAILCASTVDNGVGGVQPNAGNPLGPSGGAGPSTVTVANAGTLDQVTTAWVPDADNDGLWDPDEVALGTDPFNADSDLDGVLDGVEVAQGTNPLDSDTDNDGLDDGTESQLGTNPLLADSDGDGLDDAVEVATGTDPTLADTDGDGLNDGDEPGLGTNPLVADSDGDGLNDGDEVALGSDPTVADSDGDGLNDGDEVFYGSDPNNPDTDGDTLNDGDEVALGTDPTLEDSDSDGLLDAEELLLGTDPTNEDTDGDGTGDGEEVLGGSDPLDPYDPSGNPGTYYPFDTGDTGLVSTDVPDDSSRNWASVAGETSPVRASGCSCDSGAQGWVWTMWLPVLLIRRRRAAC